MADIASILVDGQDPSMPALRQWLQALYAIAVAGGTGVGSYAAASMLPPTPGDEDAKIAVVTDDGANTGWWLYSGGAWAYATALNAAFKGAPGTNGLLAAASNSQLDAGSDNTVTVTPAGLTHLGLTSLFIASVQTAIASLTQTTTQQIGRSVDPVSGPSNAAVNTFVFLDPVTVPSGGQTVLSSLKFYANATGNITLARGTYNTGTGAFTPTAISTVAIGSTGLKTLTAADYGSTFATAGNNERFAIYNATAGIFTFNNASTSDGTGYAQGSGAPVVGTAKTMTPLTSNVRFEVQWNFTATSQPVTASAFTAMQSLVAALNTSVSANSLALATIAPSFIGNVTMAQAKATTPAAKGATAFLTDYIFNGVTGAPIWWDGARWRFQNGNETVPFDVAAFGDSITYGVNASTPAKNWASLVTQDLGATLSNQGIAGTVLQNSNGSGGTPLANNGRDRFVSALLGANRKARVIIAYGFNDARYTGAPATFNVANYQNDYLETVSGLICGGVAADAIEIVAPYYITDAGLTSGSTGFTGQTRSGFEAFVTAALAVAMEMGTKYVPAYTWLRDNGYAATIDPADNIHPLDAGHALIRQCIETQVYTPNTARKPATLSVSSSASGQLDISWAAVPNAASYDVQYGVDGTFSFPNTANVSTTTKSFTGLSAGYYRVRVRANFADGSVSPWRFASSGVYSYPITVVGQTASFAGVADNTDLSATTPTSGAWSKNAYSTGVATMSAGAVRGPSTNSQLAIYHLATQAMSTHTVFSEATVYDRGNYTLGQVAMGPIVRSDPAAQNYLCAYYNGQSIRLFKCIGGTLTQLGSTYTVTLDNSPHAIRIEAASGAQRILLDGAVIITATESESNLTALGTGLGIRLQSAGDNWGTGNAKAPVISAVSVGYYG